MQRTNKIMTMKQTAEKNMGNKNIWTYENQAESGTMSKLFNF